MKRATWWSRGGWLAILLGCGGGAGDAAGGDAADTAADGTDDADGAAGGGDGAADDGDGSSYGHPSVPDPSGDGEVPLPEGDNGGELGHGTGTSDHPNTAHYPDGVLCGPSSTCGPGFHPDDALAPDVLAELYTRGLAAWRKDGLHGACAGCHTPDAVDLAMIGYTDEDIVRRALPHHDDDLALADDIVGLVHAVRQLYEIERPLDPATFRPYQPSFELLAGDSADDRDHTFMGYLRDELSLTWAKDVVDSLDDAKRAAAELARIDLRTIKVGLPFDRWSEDTHDTGTASHAEWIPGMAARPKAGSEDAWYALVDAYLEDPSDENLWAYYDAIDTLTASEEGAAMTQDFPLATTWMSLKWKSVQIAGHMLRHRSIAYPDVLADREGDIVQNRAVAIARSPIWHAGDWIRRYPTECTDTTPNPMPTNDSCMTFPSFVDDSLAMDAEARDEQAEQFKKSWFWSGWLYDHALVTTDDSLQTISGDYLMSTHLADYKIHHAFIVAKLSVAKAHATRWFGAQGESLDGHGKWASIRPFLVFKHIERNRNAPGENDPRHAGHARMFANLVRMWIYLVHDDLVQTGEVFDAEGTIAAVKFARSWLDETDAPALEPGIDHGELDVLIGKIETLARAATELRTDFDNGGVQLD